MCKFSFSQCILCTCNIDNNNTLTFNYRIPIERPGLEAETREWREKRMEEGREIWVKRVKKGCERRRKRKILKLFFCLYCN